MRLAIVVNSFPVLSESFIFNKVMGLRAAGLDVTVLANARSNDAAMFADRLPQNWQSFVRYATTSGGAKGVPPAVLSLARKHPKIAAKVWREANARYDKKRALKAFAIALPLAAENFDIVHFEYSGLAVAYADALPLLKPAKLMCSCRGAAEQIAPLMQPQRAEKLRAVLPILDRVHCVSEDMLQTVEGYGLPRERAFVNNPSIDAEKFRRDAPYHVRENGPFRLVSTGRLHWKKGFEFALVALRHLLEAGFDVQYDIAGGGPEEEKLRFCIHELGLSTRVRLLGRQSASEVKAALQNADIYWLPSLSEGLSNAALEAMAMQMPIISTTAGGMEEAISEGENGLLVAPFDARALADKTAILLRDGALRKRLGEAARTRIEERFTLARQIEVFVREYSQVAHQGTNA
jgi:colanic acid/amylovoran biosynthesis glycosyltransferase